MASIVASIPTDVSVVLDDWVVAGVALEAGVGQFEQVPSFICILAFSRHNFFTEGFFENPRVKSLRETREYRCLLVSMDAEVARAGTDGYTDRHTGRLQ